MTLRDFYWLRESPLEYRRFRQLAGFIPKEKSLVSAVDLFCGVGGLTKGLENAGVDVKLGIDVDSACAYPYDKNNRATFLQANVEEVTGRILEQAMSGPEIRLLAGCAPCQPFSTYRQGRKMKSDSRWFLLRHFTRLVSEVRPEIVTMENVPRLGKQDVFHEFLVELKKMGFHVSYGTVNCSDYGVPQRRERLVLLASRLGDLDLQPPSYDRGGYRTVREVIGDLPAIGAGETHECDPLHQACSLSKKNLARIRSSRPGGSWRDWDDNLIADCHKRSTGRKYSSIYGRMEWGLPAPTLTTQFYNFGSGRYGHPEQDRAISFREGALLQGFPPSYEFFDWGSRMRRAELGRLIGNAVPVQLGEAIGRAVLDHAHRYA